MDTISRYSHPILIFTFIALIIAGISHHAVLSGLLLVFCVIEAVLFFRMHQQVDILKREIEEARTIETRMADVHGKLDEKTQALAEKINETIIQRRITHTMTSTMDLHKILKVILEAVVNTLHHDRAVLFLLDEEGTRLEAKHAVGLKGIALRDVHIAMNNDPGPLMQSMKEARPLIIDDTAVYRSLLAFLHDRQEGFPEEIVVNPLIAKDKVVGLVLVDHLITKRKFAEEDLRNLLSYTQQAGMAVRNAHLYQTEKNFHAVLKREVNKARNELLDAQALVIQSERLAALGEMSAVVAHEVKNPLASIRACVQSIETGIKDRKEINPKYLLYINKEIDRLDKIVKSILAYSRPPSPRLVSFDIAVLIKETLDFMKKEFQREKVAVGTELAENISPAKIDPEMIKQVLLNLFDNALFFVSKREERKVIVRTRVQDTYVVVDVEDTGGGIDPKILPKVCDPFVTTKTQGTGLGLSICKKIIDSHNGRIIIHNHPKIGIRVEIFLPAA